MKPTAPPVKRGRRERQRPYFFKVAPPLPNRPGPHGTIAIGLARDEESFHDATVFPHLDAVVLLANDRPWIAADDE